MQRTEIWMWKRRAERLTGVTAVAQDRLEGRIVRTCACGEGGGERWKRGGEGREGPFNGWHLEEEHNVSEEGELRLLI